MNNLVMGRSAGGSAWAAEQNGDASKFVRNPKDANLIFVLSASPRKGGSVVFSEGQTRQIGTSGQVQEDDVPTFNKAAPVRYAFLTVYDGKAGEQLWSAEHLWGGGLTGFHSAGACLIRIARAGGKIARLHLAQAHASLNIT